MPEITRRRTGELLRKLFEILVNHSEGLPARVALEQLASSVKLTDYEAGMYGAGGRRFDKIVRFAFSNKRCMTGLRVCVSPHFSLNKSTARYVMLKDPTGSRRTLEQAVWGGADRV